ncbi:TolC family protein [Sinorhizobium meliloti]|nr:TolC family protein [Sinorhizobium meliloti]MDW9912858.1 TolC family protein [Sinorhizobium meliloti]MDW9943960.1 TolC family protein [Sinorhizobium meliloti]
MTSACAAQGWNRSEMFRRCLSSAFVLMLAISLTACTTQQDHAKRNELPGSASNIVPVITGSISRSPVVTPEPPRRVSINGMSLIDAVGVAISRHPDISRANAVVAQSMSEVAIAKAAWYPTIEYGVRPGYGQAYGNDGNSAGVTGSLGVNQLVYDFGRTSSRVSAADATLEKQKYLLFDTVEQVAYNTAATFVDLAASQDVISAAQRQVTALKETRTKIKERVSAGLSDASDLNQADVSIQRAEAEVLKAKTRFDVAAGKLAELTGVRPQRVANLNGTSAFISKLGSGGGDIEQTPSVLAANAAMDAANARVKFAEAERFPSVGIGVSRSMSTGQRNANDNTFVGLTLGGKFSLGGLTQHQIAAAEAERRAAAQTLENQRLVTRTAVNSADTEASGASARLVSYEKVISLSRTSRDLYWQEYTLNKRPLTEVINAEREIYFSEVERTNAIADGVLARIKAHAAIGKFVESLRAREGASR